MDDFSQLETKVTSSEDRGTSLCQILNDLYFEPKGFERWGNGKIYELLQVRYMKKICDWIGDHTHGSNPDYPNNYKLWDRTPDGLRRYESYTRFNETVHSPLSSMLFSSTTWNLYCWNYDPIKDLMR